MGHGVQAPGEGARRVVGLRLNAEAGLRGGAAACGQHPARAARKAVGCAARNAHGQPRRCRRADSRRAGQACFQAFFGAKKLAFLKRSVFLKRNQ